MLYIHMSVLKITYDAKYELCRLIFEKLHRNHPEKTIHHYAVILPTGRNSGWCEKGRTRC